MLIVDRYWYSPRQNAEGGRLSPIPPRRRPRRRFVSRTPSPSPHHLWRRSPSPNSRRSPSPSARRSPSPHPATNKVYKEVGQVFVQREKSRTPRTSVGEEASDVVPAPPQKLSKVPFLPALIEVPETTSQSSARNPPKEAVFRPSPPKIGAWQWALRGGLCNKFGDPTVDDRRRDHGSAARSSSERGSVRAKVSHKEISSSRSRARSHRKHLPSDDANSIFVVPARAAEKRNKFRQALRIELGDCETVAALETASQEAASALAKAKGGPEGSLTNLSKLFDYVLWDFDPGVVHNVWRSAIQQVVDQELLRRRHRIYLLIRRTTRELKSPPVGDEDEQAQHDSDEKRLSALSVADAPPQRRRSSMVRSAEQEREKQENKEILWRGAFGRLSIAFKLRQPDIPKALEKCGVPHPNKQWVDESWMLVAKGVLAITSDEFVKFVQTYFERQHQEYSKTFAKFDDDKSGTVDVVELKKVLKSFGIEPLLHVLEEVISEVDDDGSGVLSLPEFIELMELITVCEGFTKPELQELTDVYNRFDMNGKGSIPTGNLGGILSWLGYSLPPSQVEAIALKVDVDGGGSLDLHEFLMCMRKVRENEIQVLKAAIQEHDTDGSKSLSVNELEPLLDSLGYMADREAMLDAARDAHVNSQDMHLDELWKFVQVYRSREGLSCAECDQVDAAFTRYDAAGKGEMSTIDIGKALRWFGYQVPLLVQQKITEEVDIDKSGTLDRNELRKLIRFYWEKELKKMHYTFDEFKASNNLILFKDVAKAFQSMDFFDANRNTPVVPSSDTRQGVDRATFMSVGIEFKKAQREMFRKSAGYAPQEVARLQALFRKYDADHSDGIGCVELGQLIRVIFPVLNVSIRHQLDLLMKEIDADGPGTGSLSFDDFLRTMRQFHDIQNQERLDKMEHLVTETGFNHDEVAGFRELFTRSDLNGDGELSENEVRHMMQNVCPMGQKNLDLLHTMLTDIRDHVTEEQGQKLEGGRDSIDFPEFLLFMRRVLDSNFANIQSRMGDGKNAA